MTLGTVQSGQGSIGTRFIDTDWPHEQGLIAGSTLQNDEPNLEEEGF